MIPQNPDRPVLAAPSENIRKLLGPYQKLSVPVRLFPLVLFGGAVAGFTVYQPDWYTDPFLLILFVLFTIGQAAAAVQYTGFFRRLRSVSALAGFLSTKGPTADLSKFENELHADTPPSPEREIISNWIKLGLKGEYQNCTQIGDNARDRMSISSEQAVGLHVMINRLTLKMGFLGTLIGLFKTFPPMKNALMGLAEADGEMRFITDIAGAIDGDQYAILTTLLATALSIAVEALSIFMLEKFFTVLEVVHSRLDDWYQMALRPIVQKHYSPEGHQISLLEKNAATMENLSAVQGMVERHIGEFSRLAANVQQQLDTFGKLQYRVGVRIENLNDAIHADTGRSGQNPAPSAVPEKAGKKESP